MKWKKKVFSSFTDQFQARYEPTISQSVHRKVESYDGLRYHFEMRKKCCVSYIFKTKNNILQRNKIMYVFIGFLRGHDIQHNGIQHNNTQHHVTQHNNAHSAWKTLSVRLLVVMLSVIKFSVVMLDVALFSCHAECHYAEWSYAERRYTGYRIILLSCRVSSCWVSWWYIPFSLFSNSFAHTLILIIKICYCLVSV